MIDWQSVAAMLAALIASWATWEMRNLRKSLHDLRDALQPIANDVAYLKGYNAGKTADAALRPSMKKTPNDGVF